jgi:hypothetical protein
MVKIIVITGRGNVQIVVECEDGGACSLHTPAHGFEIAGDYNLYCELSSSGWVHGTLTITVPTVRFGKQGQFDCREYENSAVGS